MINEMDLPPTADEMMVFAMARIVRDGEIVAQGLATPLVAAAYLLARQTHAPNLYFASAIGQGVCRDAAPMSLTQVESLWLDRSLINLGFVRVICDVLPLVRPLEFFRPAQVDQIGNFNNIAFGTNYQMPRLRLPGSGGIPDVSVILDDICLYVPRHSRVTFVQRLDYLSGLGWQAGRQHGAGPRVLITDLGVFDFGNQKMRLVSYHPQATIEQIKLKTGFELEIAPGCDVTPMPDKDELRLLREEIDPLGIRKLELLGGAERRELLRRIIQSETEAERQ